MLNQLAQPRRGWFVMPPVPRVGHLMANPGLRGRNAFGVRGCSFIEEFFGRGVFLEGFKGVVEAGFDGAEGDFEGGGDFV